MQYVELHAHTHYSLMDGVGKPVEYLDRAAELEMTHMAITDHGTLAGHREFQREATARGIKPILGLEAYISPTDRFDRRPVKKREDNTQLYNHLILLAKNDNGLRNLSRLSEEAWKTGYYYKPRMDFELLAESSEDVIALSGCLGGLLSQALEANDYDLAVQYARQYKEIFKDNFYIEVQTHNPLEINAGLMKISKELGIKAVVTSDCHHVRKEDLWVQEALLILSTKPKSAKGISFTDSQKMDILDRFNYLYPDRTMTFQEYGLHLNNAMEHLAGLEKHGIGPEVIHNTVEIAQGIGTYDYQEGLDLLPRPRTGDPDALLERKARAGLKKRGFDKNPDYVNRLEEELRIIKGKNFSSYFLIEANTVDWAKSQRIRVGPGRGSGAGSLVNYALGVTEVDPIKYGLLFFRFINPERDGYPDIDTDIADKHRGRIKDYCQRQFKNVASIITFGTFGGKESIRGAARAFMVPLADVNKALKGQDYVDNWFEQWEVTPNAKDFIKKYPEVYKLAKILFGRIKSSGIHPGGIIMSKEPIFNYAPMETAKNTQDESGPRIPLVALDMVEAEDLGFIKYDFLGLSGLTVIQDTLDLIKDRRGVDINLEALDLDGDQRVYKELSEGWTRGVFQASEFAYTNMLIKMGGVKNFDELVASNALVRPGAMDSSAGEAFIKRKNGHMKVAYHHPDMEWFTKDTYGAIIYQEQVMLTMTVLAGMSMVTADKVRKIIGKKKDVSELDQYRQEFIDGASEKVGEEAAAGLWHDFEAHANYSFNKSHAVAYSMLSYWTAWLKMNYPLEFLTACLRNEKDKGKRLEFLMEAKRLGVRIMLPHVNVSGHDFEIQKDLKGYYIRFGLQNIKGLAEKSARRFIKARPFESYDDLLDKVAVKGSGMTKAQVNALNAVGAAAFDDNPRTGSERDNYYEYLDIPAFETPDLPPKVKAQSRTLDEFTENEGFVVVAMVSGIKRGPGWARLELLDDSGRAGAFTDENTPIETGRMYVMLIANNRVARFIAVDEYADLNPRNAFKRYLERDYLGDVDEGMFYVLNFKTRRTKAGKTMADAVFATGDKKLWPVMVWPQKYEQAFRRCVEGSIVRAVVDLTEDGARYLKQI